MRLPLVVADPQWCPTTATDARSIYFNEAYIEQLTTPQVEFVIAHEALHCALSHFARRQHRNQRRWDAACDLAINPLLVNDALEAPPNANLDIQFEGMSAEEIYPCLEDGEGLNTMDGHLYDEQFVNSLGHVASSGRSPMDASEAAEIEGRHHRGSPMAPQAKLAPPPQPLTQIERDSLVLQWQRCVIAAAQHATRAGKQSHTMVRLVKQHIGPSAPWRTLLDRYLSEYARNDYDYTRPSTRREGTAMMPSLRSNQSDLVVAVDTSGSIKDEEIEEFVAEINAIKGHVNARITLLACAYELSTTSPWVYETWENFSAPTGIVAGGGTNFVPVFDWIAQQFQRPDLLVYFTDAEGEFPNVEPEYPTLWVVKGQNSVPFGGRIQLN